MNNGKLTTILSGTAAVLAATALAITTFHGGPTGPRGASGPKGPQGNTGANATASHLGVCWSANYQSSADSATTWVNGVSVAQAINNNGVFTCPQGMTFVPVTPSPAQTNA